MLKTGLVYTEPFTRMLLAREFHSVASYFGNQQAASKQVSFHQLRRTRPYLPEARIVVNYVRKHRRCTLIRQTLIILSSKPSEGLATAMLHRDVSLTVFAVNPSLFFSSPRLSFSRSRGGGAATI